MTLPYPQINAQQNAYDIEVFDQNGKCINNLMYFTKDCIIIKDVTALTEGTNAKTLNLTVRSESSAYQADYSICVENVSNDSEMQQFVQNTGDVNLDQKIDVRDAVYLSRICGGDSSIILSDVQEKQADVNGDNHLNTLDLTLMLRKLARLI